MFSYSQEEGTNAIKIKQELMASVPKLPRREKREKLQMHAHIFMCFFLQASLTQKTTTKDSTPDIADETKEEWHDTDVTSIFPPISTQGHGTS